MALGEIAELHLPPPDGWNAYYDSLAALDPECTQRLMQVESREGLIATVSLARFQARATGGDQQHWYHMLQPVWSLDPLWARHITIIDRRVWQPWEVPLPIIAPRRVAERPILGLGYRWQANANVEGQPLRNGGKRFGWGIGTQADCEWEFDLPALVVGFRASVGLDEMAGLGGCARGLILANDDRGAPLFQSPHLIGSKTVLDTGAIPLAGPLGGQKTLILKSDMAHNDRPPGADPFDIRDQLDWLEPTVSLDADKLRGEAQERVSRSIPAWDDWAVSLAPRDPQSQPGRLKVTHRWEGHDPLRGDFRRLVSAGGSRLQLTRKARIGQSQKYLAISASRLPGAPGSQIQVRTGDALIASFPAPERSDDAPGEARLVPLKKFVGQTVRLETSDVPSNDQCQLDWSLADFQERETPLDWRPLRIREARAASGAALVRQPDESLLATGTDPDFDEYTLVAESDLRGVTGFRLDLLADPRLPNKGPGRGGDGSCRLGDFSVTAAPAGKPEQAEKIAFASAAASWSDNDCNAALAIDSEPDSTAWSVSGRPGRNQCAIFTTQSDIAFPATARYTFVLRQHRLGHSNLGRFRLSLTRAPRPLPVERLGLILEPRAAGVETIYEDDLQFAFELREGQGAAASDGIDRYSGDYCMRVEGQGRSNPPPAGALGPHSRESRRRRIPLLAIRLEKIGGQEHRLVARAFGSVQRQWRQTLSLSRRTRRPALRRLDRSGRRPARRMDPRHARSIRRFRRVRSHGPEHVGDGWQICALRSCTIRANGPSARRGAVNQAHGVPRGPRSSPAGLQSAQCRDKHHETPRGVLDGGRSRRSRVRAPRQARDRSGGA